MELKRVICPLALIGLLVLAGNARAEEANSLQPGDAAVQSEKAAVDLATVPFDGIVIERSLGEGANETIVVPQDAQVRLVLHAPAGMELHLHGYDLVGTAGRAAPVVLTFRAEHAGRFPIEAHGDHGLLGHGERALAYIEVRPE